MGTGLFSSFMAATWEEASIVAVVAGVVGFFVVLRGATFAAHAIPQGAFTGAAGAALVGANTMVGVGAFALIGAVSIARLGQRARHDVVTALALACMLGLGSLFLSLSSQYSEQTFSLLFGEPLAVSPGQVVPSIALGAACLALVWGAYRPLMLSSVSPEIATAHGTSPRAAEAVFLVTVAVATTLALPVVGALLVFSLMIGPPSAARFLARRPPSGIVVSAGIALATAWASVALAYISNWPLGFFVGTAGAGWYVLGRAVAARTARARATGPLGAVGPGSPRRARSGHDVGSFK